MAVTFDDGYREVYTRAWPVLRDLRIPATVFLPTGFMDGTSPAPIRAGAASRGDAPAPLTWDQVGEMAGAGLLSVGSHSVTHTDYDRISRDQAEEESAASREILRAGPAPPSTCSPTLGPWWRTRTWWPRTTGSRWRPTA